MRCHFLRFANAPQKRRLLQKKCETIHEIYRTRALRTIERSVSLRKHIYCAVHELQPKVQNNPKRGIRWEEVISRMIFEIISNLLAIHLLKVTTYKYETD